MIPPEPNPNVERLWREMAALDKWGQYELLRKMHDEWGFGATPLPPKPDDAEGGSGVRERRRPRRPPGSSGATAEPERDVEEVRHDDTH